MPGSLLFLLTPYLLSGACPLSGWPPATLAPSDSNSVEDSSFSQECACQITLYVCLKMNSFNYLRAWRWLWIFLNKELYKLLFYKYRASLLDKHWHRNWKGSPLLVNWNWVNSFFKESFISSLHTSNLIWLKMTWDCVKPGHHLSTRLMRTRRGTAALIGKLVCPTKGKACLHGWWAMQHGTLGPDASTCSCDHTVCCLPHGTRKLLSS